MTPLQGVLDNPDDDAPRLAYAAWCDENGDPRGDFIRFQIEQATGKRSILELWPGLFTPGAPKTFSGDQDWPKLREWAEPVWPLVSQFKFRRGFIDYVVLDGATWIAKGGWILDQAPIDYVGITDGWRDLGALADDTTLLRLRGLSLYQNHLRDHDVAILAASPNLRNIRTLDLSYNQIGEAGAESLASSPNLISLEHLHFDGNNVKLLTESFNDWDGTPVSEHTPELLGQLVRKFGPKRWLV